MPEVPLSQRQAVYREAEARVDDLRERWVAARVLGPAPAALERDFDNALDDLKRAKRRLEDTERRLAKKEAT